MVRRGLARGRTSRRPVDPGISELKTGDHTALPERGSRHTASTLPGRYNQNPRCHMEGKQKTPEGRGKAGWPGPRRPREGGWSLLRVGLRPHAPDLELGKLETRKRQKLPLTTDPPATGPGKWWPNGTLSSDNHHPSPEPGTAKTRWPPAPPTAAKAERRAGLPPCVAVTRPPEPPLGGVRYARVGSRAFVPRGRRRVLPGFCSAPAAPRGAWTARPLGHDQAGLPHPPPPGWRHRRPVSPGQILHVGPRGAQGPPAPPGGRELRPRGAFDGEVRARRRGSRLSGLGGARRPERSVLPCRRQRDLALFFFFCSVLYQTEDVSAPHTLPVFRDVSSQMNVELCRMPSLHW